LRIFLVVEERTRTTTSTCTRERPSSFLNKGRVKAEVTRGIENPPEVPLVQGATRSTKKFVTPAKAGVQLSREA